MPWRQANYNDFLYPTTQGDRDDVQRGGDAVPDGRADRGDARRARARKLNEVAQLLAPFELLFAPEIRERVKKAAPGFAS